MELSSQIFFVHLKRVTTLSTNLLDGVDLLASEYAFFKKSKC